MLQPEHERLSAASWDQTGNSDRRFGDADFDSALSAARRIQADPYHIPDVDDLLESALANQSPNPRGRGRGGRGGARGGRPPRRQIRASPTVNRGGRQRDNNAIEALDV